VRCGRCGNENSESNRFCGMCGAILVPKTPAAGAVAPTGTRPPEEARIAARPANQAVPVAAPPVVAAKPVVNPPIINAPSSAAPVVTPPAAAPRVDSSPASSSPGISSPGIYGPSFLGLNQPTDVRSGGGLQADSRSGHDAHRSGNLDYLLEDEEEPRRGWGKLVVVVIALALIGGFGYLRWKQGGFNFLKPSPAAKSAAGSSQGMADSAGTAPAPDAATPNPATSNSANTNSATPGDAGQSSATPDAGAGSSPAGPAAGTASGGTENGAQQATPTSGSAAPGTTSSSATPSSAPSSPMDNPSPAKAQENTSADKSTESDTAEDAEATPAKPATHAPAAAAKPSAAMTRERKPSPVTPVDITTEAERYIYGRGVRQDCDRGLRLLKPAAAQSNPKAMIALGTLYSSGTCTPRDLPTAYRWFALALHKQPDNQPLQDDLQKLWSQMTQPERQLAIKLSQ
jgi:hypothetical protein